MLNMKNFAKPGERNNMLQKYLYLWSHVKIMTSVNKLTLGSKCQTCFRAVGFRGKHSVEFQVDFSSKGVLYLVILILGCP